MRKTDGTTSPAIPKITRLLISLLLCGFWAACNSTVNPANITSTAIDSSAPTITPTLSKEANEEKYLAAIERWQAHQITSYEITVEVFSSLLAPSCQMQATLIVRDNTLIGVREIATPEVFQLPGGKLISNPECSEYERYLIPTMFNLVDTLLHKKQASGETMYQIEFDSHYGYITYLNFTNGGESATKVTTTNFTPQTVHPTATIFVTTPTLQSFTLSPTPTQRVFAVADKNCSAFTDLGHIIYLNKNNLYAMNGNGCFPQLLMKDVSVSPVWSPDGQMVAVGRNKGSEISILDTRSVFDSCVNADGEIVCQANIKVTYPLCQQESCRIQNISWAPDMARLAVAYSTSSVYNICIFSLKTGSCENILMDEHGLWVDWSPVENRLAVSNHRFGIFLVNLDGSNRIELVYGFNPAWSPDGKQIAYLKPSEDPDKEILGIASVNVDNGKWKWLYSPAPRDKHYWPPQNIGVGCGDSRGMTWSPDGKYIAASVRYSSANMFDCQIMRLEIETQSIIFLTTPTEQPPDFHYDPDWEP